MLRSGLFRLLTMRSAKETVVLKADPAARLRAELARKIASFVGKEENRITEIPAVSLPRRTAPTPRAGQPTIRV
jgi:hypothetical protein